MMGSIIGHRETENRPVLLKGCMWLWDAGLWLLWGSEDGGGGAFCVQSHSEHITAFFWNPRSWLAWCSSCLTEFQRGKWSGWPSASGLTRTSVALSASGVAAVTISFVNQMSFPIFKVHTTAILRYERYNKKRLYSLDLDQCFPTPNLGEHCPVFFQSYPAQTQLTLMTVIVRILQSLIKSCFRCAWAGQRVPRVPGLGSIFFFFTYSGYCWVLSCSQLLSCQSNHNN